MDESRTTASSEANRGELSPEQLRHFLRESSPQREEQTRRLVERILEFIPDAPIRIADFGGGDGTVLDRCLENRSHAEGILVDVAPEMLEANLPNPRKRLVQADLTELRHDLPGDIQYDVALLNVVLHHCLSGDGVSATRRAQSDVLRAIGERLTPGGRIVVLEQVQDGWVFPDVTSLLVYRLTRSRLLAPMMRSFGANTAGVGVLFAPRSRLLRVFERAGMRVEHEKLFRQDRNIIQLRLLACRRSYQQIFVLRPDAA